MLGKALFDLRFGHYPLHEPLPHRVPAVRTTGLLVDVDFTSAVTEQVGSYVDRPSRLSGFDRLPEFGSPRVDSLDPGRVGRLARRNLPFISQICRLDSEPVAAAKSGKPLDPDVGLDHHDRALLAGRFERQGLLNLPVLDVPGSGLAAPRRTSPLVLGGAGRPEGIGFARHASMLDAIPDLDRIRIRSIGLDSVTSADQSHPFTLTDRTR